MPTHGNINKCKYIEAKIDGTKVIITFIIKQTNKQTSKQTAKTK